MRVTANATRAGNWWAVDVPEVEGLFTQAKRLDLIPAMVVDAAGLLGADVTESEVDVHPQIDPAIIGGLIDARELRELATLASRYAALSQRSVARHLADDGLPLRDIGFTLGVSYQRAHQLVTEPIERTQEFVAAFAAHLEAVRDRAELFEPVVAAPRHDGPVKDRNTAVEKREEIHSYR
jgi:hypothetical protein